MLPLHRTCAVYLLSNWRRTVLYTGVTSDLDRRLWEHRAGSRSGFAHRYRAWRLVWYEVATDIRSAIEREQELKAGPRARKVALIEATNPRWEDLGRRRAGG